MNADDASAIDDLARAGALDESVEELYEHATAGYLSTLLDGLIVKANATLLGWLGRDRGDVVGRLRLQDLLSPGSRIYYETHYAPLLQMQGGVNEVAAELMRADGSRLPVLLSSRVVDDGDRPRVVRTTAFDVSERRRYERELLHARAEAESRARAALALAHVVEGVLLVGEDGAVQLLNAAAEAIFDVDAASIVGRPAAEAIAGWRAFADRVSVARAGELHATEVQPLQRGRGERWIAVAAVDAGGAVVYTLRDITAERDLDQLRGDMIAIVSHELRTPLTGVYGAAQTLLGRYEQLDDETRRQFLQMVVEQSTRLMKILDQILLTNQLDTDNLAARVEAFEAAEAIDSVLQAIEAGSRRRVIVDVPRGLRVRADVDRLRQAVANLLDNALKYASGSVRVAAEPTGSWIRFTVADDGPGIPSRDSERIFQKFFRLDPDQRAGVGGTGLGLYISRELVQRMGGRIGLLPRERGATFFIDVPVAD